MSLIKNKFVDALNPLDDTKVKLRNNHSLTARNAADTADVEIVKVDSSNKIVFGSLPQSSGTPSTGNDLINKTYFDANAGGGGIKADGSVAFTGDQSMGGHKLTNLAAPTTNGDALRYDMLGANSGIATLDSGGKVPVSQLPTSVMDFKGNWDASLNSPILIDGVGNAGDVYRVNVAGTQNLGSGSQTFAVGDWVLYDSLGVWQKSHSGADSVQSVNGATGVVTVNAINQLTGEVTAGPANGSASVGATIVKDPNGALTNAGSGLKVVTDLAGGLTVAANSLKILSADNSVIVNAFGLAVKLDATGGLVTAGNGVKIQVDNTTTKISSGNLKSLSPKKEKFTLSAGDITNQYIDLAQVAVGDSIDFVVAGLVQVENTDYSVNLTGGAGGKTRITFSGDLATAGAAALVSGDVVVIKYLYL